MDKDVVQLTADFDALARMVLVIALAVSTTTPGFAATLRKALQDFPELRSAPEALEAGNPILSDAAQGELQDAWDTLKAHFLKVLLAAP